MMFAPNSSDVAFRLDPSVSYGTIIAILTICASIIGAAWKLMGHLADIVRHMTKHEERFAQLVQEVNELKDREEKRDTTIVEMGKLLSRLVGSFETWSRRKITEEE